MNTTLRKCVECGRLFAAMEGVQQCQKCESDERTVYKRIEDAVLLDELTTVPEIAVALGVDAAVVRRVLSDLPHLAEQVENDEMCPRCGIRPANIGRDHCSACLFDLNADLKDMMGLVERDKQVRDTRPEARMRGISVSKALREKQRRTGHYRFDPVPPNIKRGR